MYHLTAGPMATRSAEDLRNFRGSAPSTGLVVQHELDDGRLVTDHGLRDVIQRHVGVYGGGPRRNQLR